MLEVILVILAVRAPQRSPVDTQGGSETTFSWFLTDLGLLFGSPGVHFGGHVGACFVKWTFFKLLLEAFFGLWKRSENGAPQGGVDMQSAHAGACFVRVGTCRPGTVLGSILGAFWEPKSALYSVLVDLGCKLGAQKQCSVLWSPRYWDFRPHWGVQAKKTQIDQTGGAGCPTRGSEVTSANGLARESLKLYWRQSYKA